MAQQTRQTLRQGLQITLLREPRRGPVLHNLRDPGMASGHHRETRHLRFKHRNGATFRISIGRHPGRQQETTALSHQLRNPFRRLQSEQLHMVLKL